MRAVIEKRWFLILITIALIYASLHRGPEPWFWRQFEPKYVAAAVLFLMSLGLRTGKLWETLFRPGPVALALAISYGLAPPLAFGLARAMLPTEYQIGLVIAGSVPCTLASAAIWTRLAGGNEALALLVTLISNSLVFLFTAGWLTLLTGQQVGIRYLDLAASLLLFVVLPVGLGQVARNLGTLGSRVDGHKQVLGVVCRLLILLIITKAAIAAKIELDRKGESWSAMDLALVIGACGVVHTALLAIGFVVGGKWFAHEDAIGVAISGSQKTLPVGVYLITEYYASVPLAIVPMLVYHVLQLLIDTLASDRFFKRRNEPSAAAMPSASPISAA